jgi:lactose/L-arabinose transport system substrate-binding protein
MKHATRAHWLHAMLSITVLLSLVLAACAPAAPAPTQAPAAAQPAQAEQPAAAQPAQGDAAKKITVWGFVWTGDWIEKIAPEFEKAHPGVKVEVGRFEYDPYQQMVLTTLASGSGVPDVVTLDPMWAGDLIRNNTVKALDKAATEMNPADFVPGGWNMYQWKGVQYGAPLDLDFNILFYRKDVYDQAMKTLGMTDFPRDTETFIKLATEVTKETGKPAILLDQKDYYIWYQSFLAPLGGSLINADGTAYNFNNEAGQQALQLFLDLINKYKVAKLWDLTADGDPMVALKAGDIMAVMRGSWFATELASGAPDMSGKWSIAALPWGAADRKTDAATGGACLSIPAGAKEPDLAWEFIKFAETQANQVEYFKIVAGVPSFKASWQDPAFAEINPYYGVAVGKLVADWSLRASPMQLPSLEISDLIGEAIQKATGGMPVKEALDEAVNTAPPLVK